MKTLSVLFSLLLAATTFAADSPYDEAADAKLNIKDALAQAVTTQASVIVVFGANWCGDCKMLDSAMKTGTSAALLAKDFKVVKVNVGRFDRNVDIAQAYGIPLQKGIPAVVILSPENKVLYCTQSGELADARRMGDNGIYEFFKRVIAVNPAKKQ